MEANLSATAAAQAGPSNSRNGGSVKPSGSLFSADEAQFMQESFSSAETFDPFTVGAPGFKVPNTLPANLGGIGSAPDASSSVASTAVTGNAYVSPSNDDLKNAAAALAVSRGGYGQDKNWHREQLQALQAERFKYMAMQNALPPSQRSMRMAANRQQQQLLQQQQQQQFSSILGGNEQLLRAPAVLPDTSNIGHSLGTVSSWPPGEGQQMMSMMVPHPAQQQQQQSGGGGGSGMTAMNGGATSGSHPGPSLSSLGAQFPSSHQFPGDDAGGMRNMSFAGMYGHPGVSQQQQQQQQPPYTSQPQQASYEIASAEGMNEGTRSGVDDGGGGSGGGGSKRNTSTSKRQSGASSAAIKASPDADVPYTFEPAPRPPLPALDLDRIASQNIIPSHLQDAFFSPELTRLQPHLSILRQEQEKRKAQGLSANIRKDRRDAKQSARPGGGGGGGDDDSGNGSEDGGGGGGSGSGKQKKQAHALLTDAEKKANHIASEQKRRANIRKGYEALCTLVPTLRDELGGGDDGADDEGEEEDDGDEDNENDEEDEAEGGGKSKRGKKRRAAGDESTANATSGERIEGKTGPRSEAMILMKAVEHIRAQVEQHHHLVLRKQQLQRQLAQKMGAGHDCFLDAGM